MNEINWHSCFFLLFAGLTCLSALAVVFTANIVRMACFLVLSLGAVSGLFFLAGADFLGAVQLMVYVGGTLVLLIFGVMLTAKGPFVSMKTGGGQWIMSIIVGGSMLAVLLQAATSIQDWSAPTKETLAQAAPDQQAEADQPTAARLGLGLMGIRADQLEEPNPQKRGGMSGQLLAFEIISIHLVVVLVGAAYLARARRRAEPKQTPVQTAEMIRLLDDLMKMPP